MTEPTPTPAPTTGTDPGTGTPPIPGTTPPTPTPPAPPPTPAPPAVDPAAEQRATAAEQASRQAKTERDDLLGALRKVLDPNGAADEQDPAKLAEQATTERDTALAETRPLRVELAAHQAAHKGGADPARLLDSRSVAAQLEALDPTDAKFGEQLVAAVEANPLLRAGSTLPAGPPKGGADFTPGAPQTVTPDQFARLSYADRVELHQSDPDLYRQLSAASE